MPATRGWRAGAIVPAGPRPIGPSSARAGRARQQSGGSILLVAVWHRLYNFVAATQAATGMLAAVVSTLIMIQGIVLIALELRARRRGRPSVLGPT
jgi:hypothetical protein